MLRLIGVNMQNTCDEPLMETVAAGLMERADQISRARLLAAARRESGLWLFIIIIKYSSMAVQ